MSNIELDERTSVLDAFSRSPKTDSGPLQPINLGAGDLITQPVGALPVAVKRDEQSILQKVKVLAAAAGSDWMYRFPVRNRRENRTDYIEGPTIKLANDLARLYGNCSVDTRVFDMGAEWLIYARFTDLETGFSMTRPFQQRKAQKSVGGGDDARALDIALQIGVSKAIRNVITNALQTFADFAFDEARNSLVDKIGKDLDGYRKRVAERLQANDVAVARVEAVIGRAVKDWLAPDIARVIAMMKAIADGMATVDETFPELGAGKTAGSGDSQAGAETSAGGGNTGNGAPAEDLNQFADGDKQDGGKPARKPRAAKADAPAQEQAQQTGTAEAEGNASGGDQADAGKGQAGAAAKTEEAPKPPKTEDEYKVYALSWIAAIPADGIEAAQARWTSEKKLRNAANVMEDVREECKAALDKKIAELKAAG